MMILCITCKVSINFVCELCDKYEILFFAMKIDYVMCVVLKLRPFGSIRNPESSKLLSFLNISPVRFVNHL